MNKKKTFVLRRRNIHISWLKKILDNKRQKFVLSVLILSLGLFFSEYYFGRLNLIFLILLSIVSDILFFLTTFRDTKQNFSFQIFILPFLYTFSFGLFYSLIPARFLTRTLITSLYAIGLYSLFLSQNIFVIASIKTITLVSSARIVSFVVTLISYFFMLNIIFSLRLPIAPISGLIFISSFLFIRHSLWTHTLDRSFFSNIIWIFVLSLCLFEISLILSFWPATPTLIALFLTGIFYTMVGITQMWFDKRLFKDVIWEYIWVAVLVFCILILFTSWR